MIEAGVVALALSGFFAGMWRQRASDRSDMAYELGLDEGVRWGSIRVYAREMTRERSRIWMSRN